MLTATAPPTPVVDGWTFDQLSVAGGGASNLGAAFTQLAALPQGQKLYLPATRHAQLTQQAKSKKTTMARFLRVAIG